MRRRVRSLLWNPRLPCSARLSSSARCWRMALATRFSFAAKAGGGQVAAAGLQHFAGCRLPQLQDRLRRVPVVRADAVQSPDRDGAHQGPDGASQGRENCHHGLHRERTRRDGGRGLWLRGRRPDKINLYVGKPPIKFNIPEAEAVDASWTSSRNTTNGSSRK